MNRYGTGKTMTRLLSMLLVWLLGVGGVLSPGGTANVLAEDNASTSAASAPFIDVTTVKPSPAEAGNKVGVEATLMSRDTRQVVVELRIKDPEGETVAAKTFEKTGFNAGQKRKYDFTWNVPVTIKPGAYDVALFVRSASDGSELLYRPNAATIHVKPPIAPESESPRFNITSHTFPEHAKPGKTVDIATRVKSSDDTKAMVDVEVYSPSGKKVHEASYDNETLLAGKKYAFETSWEVPASAEEGFYTVWVGMYSPGGETIFASATATGKFKVTVDSVPVDTSAPAVPSSLAAAAGDAEVTLTWSPVADADLSSYKVYTSVDGGATWASSFDVGLLNEYVVSGLTNGTSYTFAVSAVDLAGNESAKSAPVSALPVDTTAPAAPAGLTAEAGDTRVSLHWSANTEADAAGYKVYTSLDGGLTWNAGVHTGMETSYTVAGLTNGVPYAFAVTVLDAANNESPKSELVTATPLDRTAPNPPSEVMATAQDGAALVQWSPVTDTDVAAYVLYVSEDDGTSWQPGIEVGLATEHMVDGLTNGIIYMFQVTAKDAAGNESSRSVAAKATPADLTPPNAPEGVGAEAGEGRVTLRWNALPQAEGAAGYTVFVSEDGGTTWQAGVDAGLVTEYVVAPLTNGKPYAFAVSAYDMSGNASAKSAVVTAVPEDKAAPAVPGGLTATAGDTIVNLSWTPVTDADVARYNVYVTLDGGATWGQGIYAGVEPALTVQSLANGVEHGFAVTAIDAAGNESEKSATVFATPNAPTTDQTPPSPPNLMTGIPEANAAVLIWSMSPEPDVAAYKIYKSVDGGATWDEGLNVGRVTLHLYRGLTANVTYTFAIAAIDASDNESAKSNTVSVVPFQGADHVPPAVPTGVTVAPSNKTLNVTWNPVADTDLQTYTVYVTNDAGFYRRVTTGTTPSASIGNLTNNVAYVVRVSATDQANNESPMSASVQAMPTTDDVTPPAVPTGLALKSAADAKVVLEWLPVADADLAAYRVYISADYGNTWMPYRQAGLATQFTAFGLTNGTTYTFAVTAVDSGDNESAKSATVAGTPTKYIVPTGLSASASDGEVKLGWNAVTAADLAGYKVYTSLNGGADWNTGVSVGKAVQYTAKPLENGKLYTFAVTAIGPNGAESIKSAPVSAKPDTLQIPPDPAELATVLPNTNNVSFAEQVSFLYTGETPIQTGVTPGTLEAHRMSVLTGVVKDTAGQPLSGVKVSVLNMEQTGMTATRPDGRYDIVVNANEGLTLQYEKAGYMTVQRKSTADWNEYHEMPEVVLTAYDTNVTPVTLAGSAEALVAQGSPVTDEDGTRQATLVFQPGTTAEILLPDGGTMPADTLHVRATEYTVGPNGEAAMPGELPSQVAYTYAVELSADEAVAAGGKSVQFSKAVFVYVDNFLDLKVGSIVPNGFYNLETGAWEAEEDGWVIRILSVEGGSASIDMDGDGAADTDERLESWGWTAAERQKLASLYPAGKELWRVPVTHFSPYDYNFSTMIPDPALMPPAEPPRDEETKKEKDKCKRKSSIIGCERQTLGQEVPIAGTSVSLEYNSSATEGYLAGSTLKIPVTEGAGIPEGATGVRVTLTIAGRTIEKEYPVSALGEYERFTYTWDGLDRYGRKLVGEHTYKAKVTYMYPVTMWLGLPPGRNGGGSSGGGGGGSEGGSFGGTPRSVALSGYFVQGRGRNSLNREYAGYLNSPANAYQEAGIAGWSLSGQNMLSNLQTHLTFEPVEDPALGSLNFSAQRPANTFGADGSYYFARGVDIYRIPYGEASSTKIGTLPSSNDQLLVVAPDGTLYAKNAATQNISRRSASPDSDWETFAGNGTPRPVDGTHHYYEDGTPAKSISWSVLFRDYEIGPDGQMYFLGDSGVLYRVDHNGFMYNYAVGEKSTLLDNYKGSGASEGAASKENIGYAMAIEVGKDGTIYILQSHAIYPCKTGCELSPNTLVVSQIKAITPSGEVRVVAGVPFASSFEEEPVGAAYNLEEGLDQSQAYFQTVDFELDEAGNLYFEQNDPTRLVKRIYKVDESGVIQPFGEDLIDQMRLDATKGNNVSVDGVISRLLEVGENGDLYFSVFISGQLGYKVYRIGQGKAGADSTLAIPDDSGAYADIYSLADGRKLRTVSALTGKTHFSYEYDEEKRLTAMKDYKGDAITIRRNADGKPIEIVSPYGQVTKLTVENGRLTAVENPAGEIHRMEYDANGLLKQFVTPEEGVKHYDYDDKGLLVRAQSARDGVMTLARTELPYGHEVKVTDADQKVSSMKITEHGAYKNTEYTDSDGAVTTVFTGYSQGSRRYADGSVDLYFYGVDPQWGEKAVVRTRHITANKEAYEQLATREADLADSNDPFSARRIKTTVNLEGAVRTSEYFADERKVVNTTPEGRSVVYYMDEWDRTIRMEEPGTSMAPTIYAYDDRNRVTRIDKGTLSITYTYNAAGLVETETNSAGDVKTYGYDDANRIASVLTPEQELYLYGYDDNGNLTTITMPNGDVVHQRYSKNDEFESLTFGDSPASLQVRRTPGSERDSSTLWSGRTIDYRSENDGVMEVEDDEILRTFTAAEGEQLGRYEQATSVTKNVYADEQTLHFGYDGLNLNSVTFSGDANGAFSYTYDKLGMPKSFSSTITSDVYGEQTDTLAIEFNKDFGMTQHGSVHYEYDGPNKRLSRMTDGAMTVDVAYDDLGRFESMTYKIGDRVISKTSYTYNLRNSIETKTLIQGGKTEVYSYGYDRNGQLTKVERTDSNGGSAMETYEYDDNRNRTLRSATGTAPQTSVYDAFDKLLQAGDTAYTYNVDGYLERRGDDTFRYGAKDELIEAAANGDAIHYTWDAIGRMTAREDGQGKTQYLYGDLVSPKLVTATIDPQGVVTTYRYDARGYLMHLERGGETYYVVTDQMGTPMQVTDESGDPVKELRYDSFGVLLEDSNPAFRLDIGFAGGVTDEDTGLVRFGSRDYDPASGRWTAFDPIYYESGSANLYAYVDNNPVNFRDPCGQACIGFSFYSGWGGGLKVCIDDDGNTALCGEFGVGIGGGLDVSLTESVPEASYVAFEVGAKVKGGPFSIAGGYEWKREMDSPCIEGAPKLSVGFGPYEYDVMSPSESKRSWSDRDDLKNTAGDVIDNAKKNLKDEGWSLKNNLEAAAKLKGCRSSIK